MFTGIIEKTGTLLSVDTTAMSPRGHTLGLRWTLLVPFEDLTLGESVAVNGVCLTVTSIAPTSGAGAVAGGFEVTFDLGPDTLRDTALGALTPGSKVHLERALQASTRLSGHYVQGHVDGVALCLQNLQLDHPDVPGTSAGRKLTLRLPAGLARYVVAKGSISVDGVSLTIQALRDQPDGSSEIDLMIIPHTSALTRLGDLSAGDSVNIEVDILAKYVERLRLIDGADAQWNAQGSPQS